MLFTRVGNWSIHELAGIEWLGPPQESEFILTPRQLINFDEDENNSQLQEWVNLMCEQGYISRMDITDLFYAIKICREFFNNGYSNKLEWMLYCIAEQEIIYTQYMGKVVVYLN